MHVLVAIFESELRDLLSVRLREHGHEPLTASDPASALERQRQRPCPWILLEATADGAELLPRLRAVEPGGDAYVQAVARHSDMVRKLIVAGADDGLVLPTEKEVLDLRLEVAARGAEKRLVLEPDPRPELGPDEDRLRLTQLTVDHAADGVFWIGRDARFLYVNETACERLGYSLEELQQMTVHDIDPDFPPEVWEESWREVRQGGTFTRESRHRTKYGEVFPVEIRVHCVRWEDEEVHVAVARDITKRKRAEKMLRYNAFHDALTGLPNRALFMDRLQHCMDLGHRRSQHHFAVLFLDLDRFKGVNDSFGHVVGDELLKALAQRLRSTLRSVDTVARIGGDEFLILVEDVDSGAQVTKLAERVQSELQRAFRFQEREVFTSVSIGVAYGDGRYRYAVEILRDADIAMYRSKARGGGCTTVFDRETHGRAVSRIREAPGDGAFPRDEFPG